MPDPTATAEPLPPAWRSSTNFEPEEQVINFNVINGQRNLAVDQTDELTAMAQRMIERVAEDEDEP